MIELLIRLFVRDSDQLQNPVVRRAYGTLAGALGIGCNLVLFAVKLGIAFLTNSLTVAADAVNNLSDAGSSIVTLFGFRMANRPPDEDHPFGHGRMEYIAGLVVAMLIVLVGFEFLKRSYQRIADPSEVIFSWLSVGILFASIGVKFWMFLYNRDIGKRIHSEVVKAAAFDSLSDILVTSITLLSLVLARFTAYPLDGYFGLIVGAFVIYGGIKIVQETVSPLLGNKPDPELVSQLRKNLLEVPEILGVHDIIIHSYGHNRFIASAHAEADYRTDPFVIHNALDDAEKKVGSHLQMLLTLHYDPVNPEDPESRKLTGLAESIVSDIDPFLHIHDLRVLSGKGENEIRVCFDVVVPREYKMPQSELRERIVTEMKKHDRRLQPIVEIEHSYI